MIPDWKGNWGRKGLVIMRILRCQGIMRVLRRILRREWWAEIDQTDDVD